MSDTYFPIAQEPDLLSIFWRKLNSELFERGHDQAGFKEAREALDRAIEVAIEDILDARTPLKMSTLPTAQLKAIVRSTSTTGKFANEREAAAKELDLRSSEFEETAHERDDSPSLKPWWEENV